MSYGDILRTYNLTNLPTDPISASGGVYTITYSIFTQASDIETIDYESDTDYYGSSSTEETNFQTLETEIEDAIEIIFKTGGPTDNYSAYFSAV